MTPPDVFVPVPLRWRHVVVGDLMVSSQGDPWMITAKSESSGQVHVTARLGDREFSRPVDPDDVVTVLVQAVERDAVNLTRELLGARLVERRKESPH